VAGALAGGRPEHGEYTSASTATAHDIKKRNKKNFEFGKGNNISTNDTVPEMVFCWYFFVIGTCAWQKKTCHVVGRIM
jgi:hypothetical protein